MIGCELLSEVSIFDIRNNSKRIENRPYPVVNCFQKLVSLIFGTTSYSLSVKNNCCELLSEVSIFDIRNNYNGRKNLQKRVVNCFQKLVSLIFGTTSKRI